MAKKPMSDDHKAALAKGRAQGRAVRDYLAILDMDRRRGPRLTPERIEERLVDVRRAIDAETDPVHRLELVQKRLDLEEALANLGEEHDVDALEAAFVGSAREYGERKGISYHAWREIGVPADVLKRAGVARTRRATGA